MNSLPRNSIQSSKIFFNSATCSQFDFCNTILIGIHKSLIFCWSHLLENIFILYSNFFYWVQSRRCLFHFLISQTFGSASLLYLIDKLFLIKLYWLCLIRKLGRKNARQLEFKGGSNNHAKFSSSKCWWHPKAACTIQIIANF